MNCNSSIILNCFWVYCRLPCFRLLLGLLGGWTLLNSLIPSRTFILVSASKRTFVVCLERLRKCWSFFWCCFLRLSCSIAACRAAASCWTRLLWESLAAELRFRIIPSKPIFIPHLQVCVFYGQTASTNIFRDWTETLQQQPWSASPRA